MLSLLWDKYWIKPLNVLDEWVGEGVWWHRFVLVIICMLIMAAFVLGMWIKDKIRRKDDERR